ncbi:MAG: TetR/AcrR family transcriptional regulator [Thermoleophilia bacterium]
MSTAPDPRVPLSRDRIVRTALALVDGGGPEALSMRRLGGVLGVEAMSLYKHVAGKEAILDGIRALLIEDFAARLPAGPVGDWREDLAAFARAYRAVGRDHPRAFPLLAQGPGRAYVVGAGVAEETIARLQAAGLDRDAAILAQRTIVRFVLGASLIDRAADDAPAPVAEDELAALAAERPLVGELMRSMDDPATDDALFEFGLQLLLDGIAVRFSPGTPGSGSRGGSRE